MFAYCDVDGSGTVTLSELEDGWEFMLKTMVEQTMKSSGLSTIDIVMAIFSAIFLLGCLFSFIFLALKGWYSSSQFSSVVQTSLVSISGKVATSLRRRTKAEEGDVEGVLKEVNLVRSTFGVLSQIFLSYGPGQISADLAES